MDDYESDPEIPLELMKSRIDKKMSRIMSILNIRSGFQFVSRRIQTEPNEYEADDLDDEIVTAQRDGDREKSMVIQGFPLTSRQQLKPKVKTLSKTYTSRELLNKKKATNSKLNTTSSTIHNTSTLTPTPKFEKRNSRPEQIPKKKKPQQPIILKPQTKRIQVHGDKRDKIYSQIDQLIIKNREQNQNSYIQRQKMLQRIAKLSQYEGKK